MCRILGMGRVLAFAIPLGILSVSTGALAQVAADDPKVIERLPDICQKERIQASGNARPTKFLAMKSAQNHWKDQALSRYGERYAVFDNAVLGREECYPAAFAGFRRCTISGFPCTTKVNLDAYPNISALNKDEIKEMQRLIIALKAKPSIKADGQFGVRSQEAFEYLVKKGIVKGNDSLPTRDNLEALRAAAKK